MKTKSSFGEVFFKSLVSFFFLSLSLSVSVPLQQLQGRCCFRFIFTRRCYSANVIGALYLLVRLRFAVNQHSIFQSLWHWKCSFRRRWVGWLYKDLFLRCLLCVTFIIGWCTLTSVMAFATHGLHWDHIRSQSGIFISWIISALSLAVHKCADQPAKPQHIRMPIF